MITGHWIDRLVLWSFPHVTHRRYAETTGCKIFKLIFNYCTLSDVHAHQFPLRHPLLAENKISHLDPTKYFTEGRAFNRIFQIKLKVIKYANILLLPQHWTQNNHPSENI